MKSDFVVHGVLPICNYGGLEIQIDDANARARIRANYGSPATTARWQNIKYNRDGEPYITFHNVKYLLNDFMKTN